MGKYWFFTREDSFQQFNTIPFQQVRESILVNIKQIGFPIASTIQDYFKDIRYGDFVILCLDTSLPGEEVGLTGYELADFFEEASQKVGAQHVAVLMKGGKPGEESKWFKSKYIQQQNKLGRVFVWGKMLEESQIEHILDRLGSTTSDVLVSDEGYSPAFFLATLLVFFTTFWILAKFHCLSCNSPEKVFIPVPSQDHLMNLLQGYENIIHEYHSVGNELEDLRKEMEYSKRFIKYANKLQFMCQEYPEDNLCNVLELDLSLELALNRTVSIENEMMLKDNEIQLLEKQSKEIHSVLERKRKEPIPEYLLERIQRA